jgi:hypothetical protein
MTVTSRDLSPPPSAAGAAGGKQHRSKEAGSTTRGVGSMTEKDGSVSIHTWGTPRGTARHTSCRSCCTPTSDARPATFTSS